MSQSVCVCMSFRKNMSFCMQFFLVFVFICGFVPQLKFIHNVGQPQESFI